MLFQMLSEFGGATQVSVGNEVLVDETASRAATSCLATRIRT